MGVKTAPIILLLCGMVLGCGSGPTSPASAQTSSTPGTISFSGFTWDIRTSLVNRIGAGPNFFSDSPNNVSVDSSGRLHMKITKMIVGGVSVWYSSEVVLRQSLGYGQYIFNLEGGFENMDINAVLGLFTYDADAPPNYREIDFEFTRDGVPGNKNSQFVIQPFQVASNIFRFDFGSYPNSSHVFNWTPSRVDFTSRGGSQNVGWTYTGTNVPTAGNEKARIELWMIRDRAPATGAEIEVIVRSFEFRR